MFAPGGRLIFAWVFNLGWIVAALGLTGYLLATHDYSGEWHTLAKVVGYGFCQGVAIDTVRILALSLSSPALLPALLPGQRSMVGYVCLRGMLQATYWVLKFVG